MFALNRIDGWMDGSVDGWMDGWADRWELDREICRFSSSKDKCVLWGNQGMLFGPELEELSVAISKYS